ncbi:Uracil-DNA glycosylase, 4 family protein [Candidatus Promineifilum breve]|uniref:Type-4 uracil-DNA glycosylase n=1 Tax=Candidatus Promineifilum breve TaxID=1806508 RepID=A0A160T2X0_9CHLR|nr:uracil-DNA glycosylase [Candidatus Promineifilum breve]CUS03619.2 Uracil-DNA glycosylase, 4 family protein [Candidatus Promineifilum breve]
MQFGLFEERPQSYPTLDALVAAMMKLEDDPLFPAGTNMVIYRGNPQARLMIVGEAPGTEEDRQGKPFVGRSGQLLDQILRSADFDPDKDVFITNSVFRLPPGDDGKPLRKPTSDEIAYYKPYLLEIVRLVDPLLMLLTGNVATESLLGQTGITRLRGQWFRVDGRWAMPIFHPAYLLRNPSREPGSPKALMWQDIKEAKRKYDELVGKPAQ